jgi:hypothetical protein
VQLTCRSTIRYMHAISHHLLLLQSMLPVASVIHHTVSPRCILTTEKCDEYQRSDQYIQGRPVQILM